MKLFIDTNILLDVILERQPFALHSSLILKGGWDGKFKLYASSSSIITVHYVIASNRTKSVAMAALIRLKEVLKILSVDQSTIDKAIKSDPFDFEDAVQYFTAQQGLCDIIISRDKKGFNQFDISCQTPNEFLNSLAK